MNVPIKFSRPIWIVTVAAFLLLLGCDISTTIPPLPAHLALRLKLPVGIPGRVEPIVATGSLNHGGNFLLITYEDEQTVVFSHTAAGQSSSSLRVTFKPGDTYEFGLEMPALATAGLRPAPTGALLLKLGGHDILRANVPFQPVDRSRIFLAENPVGWTAVGVTFRGEIIRADGKRVRGRVDSLFTTGQKMRVWLATAWWHLAPLLFASFGTGWLIQRFLSRRANGDSRAMGDSLAARRWFVAATVLNLFVFWWLMTGGNFRLIYPDAGGVFYDFQAQSLLEGRLDVPENALRGEAFMLRGKAYGYFGLTPAVLRMPLVAAKIGFGHLTRCFLLADFLASLVAAYFILQYANEKTRGAGSSPSAWAVVLAITATGIGSSLLFLGSRAYVYHEAILCGVAFAMWSSYFSLRYLDSPQVRWWVAALGCGVLSVQCRPTTGLFALGLLGAVALTHILNRRAPPASHRAPWMVGALAALGLLSVQMVAYLRFGITDGAPLQYHVQYTPERLAKIDGKKFHLVNVPHNFDAFLFYPAFRLDRHFPFFIFDLAKRAFPKAKMDLVENTVAIPYAMAGLTILAMVGCGAGLKIARLHRPVGIVLLASVPGAASMLAFVATSHRYTADAVPSLFALAAFGLAFLDSLPGARRTPSFAAVTAGTAFSFLLTAGLAFHFQVDLCWGVPEEVRSNFFDLREWTDRWLGLPRTGS